jgi:hypothetical protein
LIFELSPGQFAKGPFDEVGSVERIHESQGIGVFEDPLIEQIADQIVDPITLASIVGHALG